MSGLEPSRRVRENRAAHQRYKQDVQKRGKPFFPYAMFHDTVMSLVVVCVIVLLAAIWRVTATEEPAEAGSGWLGPLYNEEADPGTTNFIPRPDWYFYFLFYLLRIFKWPESVLLATVGIPTIIMMLMIALPFLDVRRERRLSRRPVAVVITVLTVIAMATLTYKGATARESLGSEVEEAVPVWAERQGLSEEGAEGGRVFALVGCVQCHTYLGTGSANLGAPDLSSIGASPGKDAEYFARYVANPNQFGNNVMPRYADLGEENLRRIGIFLEESKGPK